MGSFPRRNRWVKGDWLVIDQESGMTKYASQVGKDYTGALVTKRFADYEQPQDFVKALTDPRPIPFASPGITDFHVCNAEPYYVGNTNVVAQKDNAADHLFNPGLGQMEIGCSFYVHPAPPF